MAEIQRFSAQEGNESPPRRRARAVGWYLMVPPVTSEGLTDPNATLVNGAAPISHWVIFRAYDSADQCEQERQLGQLALVDAMKANPELLTDRAQFGLKAMELLKKGGAQCIATDDPRLKGN